MCRLHVLQRDQVHVCRHHLPADRRKERQHHSAAASKIQHAPEGRLALDIIDHGVKPFPEEPVDQRIGVRIGRKPDLIQAPRFSLGQHLPDGHAIAGLVSVELPGFHQLWIVRRLRLQRIREGLPRHRPQIALDGGKQQLDAQQDRQRRQDHGPGRSRNARPPVLDPFEAAEDQAEKQERQTREQIDADHREVVQEILEHRRAAAAFPAVSPGIQTARVRSSSSRPRLCSARAWERPAPPRPAGIGWPASKSRSSSCDRSGPEAAAPACPRGWPRTRWWDQTNSSSRWRPSPESPSPMFPTRRMSGIRRRAAKSRKRLPLA